MKVLMIDPTPDGWKYGFPKPAPSENVDLDAWAVEQGYPKELAYSSYRRYRFWEEEQ